MANLLISFLYFSVFSGVESPAKKSEYTFSTIKYLTIHIMRFFLAKNGSNFHATNQYKFETPVQISIFVLTSVIFFRKIFHDFRRSP